MKTEFRFLYKSPAVSATNPDFNWIAKYYTLDELVRWPMRDLCAFYYFCELVAKSQYIGRVDCEGNRVFDGDILRDPKSGDIFSISWSYGNCGFRADYGSRGLCSIKNKVGGTDGAIVIGNKYQNPELLQLGAG